MPGFAEALSKLEAHNARLDALGAEYCAEYGFERLTRRQIAQMEKAKERLSKCEGCRGKCPYGSYLRPVISPRYDDGIAYELCEYGESELFRRACSLSAVPYKYASKTFEDYEITSANERAVGYAKWYALEQPNRGLYLYGSTGAGKTFLASLIAKEYISKSRRVIFGDVPTLLEEIKATFDGSGSTAAVLERYMTSELLVLDDLGAGNVTEWNTGILYQLINRRYNDGAPLLITSNFSIRQLGQRFTGKDLFSGQRLVSRLTEMCIELNLGTQDWRRKNAD